MSARAPMIGYVTSRFPKLTETFVLYEILGLERAGLDVVLYPLLRERADVVHPDAVDVMERAQYLPFVSRTIVKSHLALVRRSPGTYLRTLLAVLRGTYRSANFLVGAVGIFPKVGHAARLLARSEEHASELQSRQYLVCRLLLEKKKTTIINSLTS